MRLALGHGSLWVAATGLLLAAAVAADRQGGPADLPAPVGVTPPASEEPITPIPQPPVADPLKLRLGEQLFRDPRLSRGNMRSCAMCHNLDGNGASPMGSSVDGKPLRFNTSTVFNAALSFRLGWEGGVRTLQRQAGDTIVGPAMGGSLPEVISKLRHDPQITQEFRAAYGHEPDVESVTDAIATFERSLLTPGGRFDRWLQGDTGSLSAYELQGYQLFKSLGCSACHQGMNVGGNLFQRHGIFHPLARPDPEILRVPSLRNVAATPPYFHDGSAPSLQEAVRQMACAQLDDSLTDRQVDAIVAFLRTLSGEYQGRPIQDAQSAQDAMPARHGSGAAPECPGSSAAPER